MSNEVECPESWQEQPGAKLKRLLLGGPDAVRGWNWSYPDKNTEVLVLGRRQPVPPIYMWMLQNGETPVLVLLWVRSAAPSKACNKQHHAAFASPRPVPRKAWSRAVL